MKLCVTAELLKLRRQRHALFWGFIFVPAFMLLVGFVLAGGLRGVPPGLAVETIRPLRAVARALGVGGNPVAQLFYAVGAAAIFAVEYRHSGWRHLVPRASRESLLLSKFAAYALVAALSLVLVAAGEALVTLLLPLVQGANYRIADAPGAAGVALLSFLLAFAELLAFGAIALFVAVLTRSAMAAILVPFLLALGSSLVQAWLGASAGDIPLPIFAGNALRLWLAAAEPSPELARSALFGAATLLGWIAAGLGGAIALFARQDLVSE